jgi:hypothetical protein
MAQRSGLRAEIRFEGHQSGHRISVWSTATELASGFFLRSGISIDTCSR